MIGPVYSNPIYIGAYIGFGSNKNFKLTFYNHQICVHVPFIQLSMLSVIPKLYASIIKLLSFVLIQLHFIFVYMASSKLVYILNRFRLHLKFVMLSVVYKGYCSQFLQQLYLLELIYSSFRNICRVLNSM